MRKLVQALSFCFVAVLLVASTATADTVVLTNGKVLTGKVRIMDATVRIETKDGVLTIARNRIQTVAMGEEKPAPAKAQVPKKAVAEALAKPLAAKVEESPKPVEAGATAGGPAGPEKVAPAPTTPAVAAPKPASVEKALATKISVDFENVPLKDAFTHLQEITGLNISYKVSDLEKDPMPVTLHLKNVYLRQVLNLMLEARNLGWSVRGDVIRIASKSESSALKTRHYDVRDLLVDTGERTGVRAPTLAERPGTIGGGAYGQYGMGGYGGYSASFGPSGYGGQGTGYLQRPGGLGGGYGGYGAGGYGGNAGYGGLGGGYGSPGGGESQWGRADALRVLIVSTVAPGSWEFGGGIGGGGPGGYGGIYGAEPRTQGYGGYGFPQR